MNDIWMEYASLCYSVLNLKGSNDFIRFHWPATLIGDRFTLQKGPNSGKCPCAFQCRLDVFINLIPCTDQWSSLVLWLLV